MPRNTITAATLIGSYPALPLAADAATLALEAADVVNLNAAAFGNATQLLVLAINTDTGAAHNVTITSKADGLNRTGDISNYNIDQAPGSGESTIAAFGPFQRAGWKQSDNNLYFQADNVAVKFAILAF